MIPLMNLLVAFRHPPHSSRAPPFPSYRYSRCSSMLLLCIRTLFNNTLYDPSIATFHTRGDVPFANRHFLNEYAVRLYFTSVSLQRGGSAAVFVNRIQIQVASSFSSAYTPSLPLVPHTSTPTVRKAQPSPYNLVALLFLVCCSLQSSYLLCLLFGIRRIWDSLQ